MGENRDKNRNIPGFASVITLAPTVLVVSFAFTLAGVLVRVRMLNTDRVESMMESIGAPLWVLILVWGVLYAVTALVLSVSFARYYESRSDSSDTNGDAKSGKSDYFVGFVLILAGGAVGSIVSLFALSPLMNFLLFLMILFVSLQDWITQLFLQFLIYVFPVINSAIVVMFTVALIHLCYAVGLPSKLGME